jgi:ParB/RepB/Spo0J family partition protein
MKIENLKVSELVPYEKNPRRNDTAVDSVAESIKQFGFQQPIVVDKNNVIVVGHTRYKSAQKLGLQTVPCVRADQLTKEQVKAYRILDNKLNELATRS